MKKHVLSKSKIMNGLQCEKLLWLKLHRPELEPEVAEAIQMQYDEGNEVGEKARAFFGKGTLVENDYWDFVGAAKNTSDLISKGIETIFEASFFFDPFFARADILNKRGDTWELIEVKKSTSVKEYHLMDSAIQAWIIESSGLKLSSIQVMHINRECEHPNLKNLFQRVDVTSEVRSLMAEVADRAKNLVKTISAKTEPKKKIGPHCDEPFECPLKGHCWKDVPQKSVFALPSLRTKQKWDLYDSGKTLIADLDENDYKGKIKRAIEVTKSAKLWIDKKPIATEIENWKWPLYFFDFETVGPAIPRYERTRPYIQIPFQFSCHVWTELKSNLEHFEYLHTAATDPRDAIIKAMLQGFGDEGSIVAYNKSFEIGVIKKLAEYDSKNADRLLALIDRFVDPLPLFQNYVYHPDFHGSFSIKSVAPAIVGASLNYEHLDVGDGSTAQAFANQILRGNLKDADMAPIIESLLTYCRQDTIAMVEIVKWLIAKTEEKSAA